MILLWALMGCPKPASKPADGLVEAPQPPPPPPSGQLQGGWYVDRELALRVPLLPGWLPETGVQGGSLRLGLTEPASGSRLEVYALPTTGLPKHDDCAWTFQEHLVVGAGGSAGMAPGAEEHLVAHCTPLIPDQPRVLARCAAAAAAWLCVELRPATGYLAEHQGEPGRLLENILKAEQPEAAAPL